MKQRLLLILIPFFALFTQFYGVLGHLRISLFHNETLILAGLLVVVCLALGGFLVVAGGKTRIALLALLTYVVFDISAQFDFFRHMEDFTPIGWVNNSLAFVAIVGTVAVLYVLLWIIRKHAAEILAVAFGVMFVTTIAVTSPPIDTGTSTLTAFDRKSQPRVDGPKPPPWIHIIFDEMTAPEAIDQSQENGRKLYERTLDFYSAHGFRLYGHAFSRFSWTFPSLSGLVNFDTSGLNPNAKYTDDIDSPEAIHTNAYFRQATEAGYEIHVYQTKHFDFCQSSHVTRCETLNSFSPVSRFVHYSEKNFLYRTANLAAIVGTHGGTLARIIGSVLNRLGGFGIWFDSEAFPLWFEQLSHEIVNAPRGRMIFAHILVPHAPFVLGEHCEYKGRVRLHYHGKNTLDEKAWPAFRSHHNERYYNQTLCVYEQLGRLFRMLDVSGRFGDAVFIIHGDHGSRIARSYYVEYMSAEDMIANHATLFAIRKPGVAPGYDVDFISLQHLFTNYVAPVSERASHDRVIVKSLKNDALQEVAMPEFAAQAGSIKASIRP